MRIDRLTASNFKKFEKESFEFHPQFTLLVGDNGTGKTAVLDALRIGVGAYLLGIPHSPAPSIKREYVRRETQRNGEFSTFEPITPCAIGCEGRVHLSDFSGTANWPRSMVERIGSGRGRLRSALPNTFTTTKREQTFL